MADRSQFDIVLPIAFAKSPGEKSHLMSASIMFDSIGLPLVVTAVFTPLTPPMRRQDALGGGGGGHGGEPTIDVQVGGSALNPVIRPVSLSSLAYMWMV